MFQRLEFSVLLVEFFTEKKKKPSKVIGYTKRQDLTEKQDKK